MTGRLRTVLVGLGKIGATYVGDNKMSMTVPYVTHAQVLADHPQFRWDAAVDISEDAREYVSARFGIDRVVRAIEDIDRPDMVDVLVLATPPSSREAMLDAFPNLRAVLVEKPLGATLKESEAFVDKCKRRGIVTQVNLTRRADQVMCRLASGELTSRIGKVQCGFGVYGNGIVNYAPHTIDLVRMLVGEIKAVQALNRSRKFREGPLTDDQNLSFTLFVEGDASVTLHPVQFGNFREGSLDLWGEKGRLEILQEGLLVRTTALADCRSLAGAFELASDNSSIEATGYGRALFDLYDDLAETVNGKRASTCSPCNSALATERVVHTVLSSRDKGGTVVELP